MTRLLSQGYKVNRLSNTFKKFYGRHTDLVGQYKIKGSIEPTHGSVCSDVRKLQSMDVLTLQSTKADWNTKCPFHILAYIYSNLMGISTSYFIKILSYRERLDIDSQRIKKMHLSFGFQGWKSRKRRKVNL